MTTTEMSKGPLDSPVLGAVLTSAPFTRVDGLWFEDGGLIIRAQDTVFRVYREMLASHAAGFSGMLAAATPEMMDRCPFVHLPDTAKDIEYFLKALFDFRFFKPHPARTTFPVLYSVLRMSHKYDAADLLKRALVHFSSAFPTSLAQWADDSDGHNASWSSQGYEIPTLAVARQVSANWVIPAAVYRICEFLNLETLLAGVCISGSPVTLSQRDQIVVIEASMFLRCDATNQVLEFLLPFGKADSCDGGKVCSALRLKVHAFAEGWRCVGNGHHMPLKLWEADDFKKRLKGVCHPCMLEMKLEHRRALESLWDHLPTLCDLPGWDELRKQKRAAEFNNFKLEQALARLRG
ncbi:hypothetical protein C8R46DRAFT_1144891 [Mycena filopes]|nr:hypothetical protein C8R46DRAFT_1144891 [Mycena filopes]